MKINKIYLIFVILIGALVFYGIKIDRKLNKLEIPDECVEKEYAMTMTGWGPMPGTTTDKRPNAYQDFLITSLKNNVSPECNLLFSDCLKLELK